LLAARAFELRSIVAEDVMRAALKLSIVASIAGATTACHKSPQQPSQDQNIAIGNGISGNADIETLPPDESSQTTSNELANGSDNPDVNASGNSD
jgi:hypothetical protein